MPFPFGAAIGAIGSLVGGIMSSKSSASSAAALNKANIAAQKDTNKMNKKLTMEVNKNQIQWLVRDAQKAGIHPLAALGSSAAGNIAAPVMGSPTISALAGNSTGAGVAAAAQTLGQGIDQMLLRENAALQNEQLMLANATSRTGLAVAAGRARGDTLTMPNPLGGGYASIKQDPRVNDADKFEQRYGEMSDWIFGPAIAYGDLKHTLGFDPFDPAQAGTALGRYLKNLSNEAFGVPVPARPGSIGKGRYNK